MTQGLAIVRRMAFDRSAERTFLGVSALLFGASAAVTIVWSASMSAMGGMPMPGGWTMSMAWMRMPGQTWIGAATTFLAMWVVMMVAMMLPSLVPMLWRYRQAVNGDGETRLGLLSVIVGVAYLFVWAVIGIAIYPVGIALAELEMQRPSLSGVVPLASGIVVFIAGAFQFTAWKMHHLVCCRASSASARGCPSELRRDRTLPADSRTAWQHGLRLGFHCASSSAGLTAILLVAGVMDLRAMAMVTVAVTAERLAPAGEGVARAIGAIAVASGLLLIARAAGLGTP